MLEINQQGKRYNYVTSYLPCRDYLENRKHRLTIDDFENYMKCPMCTKHLICEIEKDIANVGEII